ncbi:hypothetical protein T06_6542 [Trichinella sp. T6]|nr:hypothetical protein T06_6542 [Trichinella sp. T6]
MASLVMETVLNCVLSQDPEVRRGTSAGIWRETHERAADGAHLLGLKVWGEQGKLMLKRDNDVGVAADELTRRSVFLYCGKLVAHFPVCGWLRIAATYIKRKANDATTSWDEVIEGGKLRDLIQETALVVWVDASSQAVGVALEIGGSVVEDVAWLSLDDAQHINMAELDALADNKDSSDDRLGNGASVGDGRPLQKNEAEDESDRRNANQKKSGHSAVAGRGVRIGAVCRTSEVREQQGGRIDPPICAATADLGVGRMIADVHHAVGHPGIKRTLCFARQTDLTVSKQQVRQVISNCEPCKSLDPASEKWKRGNLEVEEAWQRVGDNVRDMLLTLIDWRPSRIENGLICRRDF